MAALRTSCRRTPLKPGFGQRPGRKHRRPLIFCRILGGTQDPSHEACRIIFRVLSSSGCCGILGGTRDRSNEAGRIFSGSVDFGVLPHPRKHSRALDRGRQDLGPRGCAAGDAASVTATAAERTAGDGAVGSSGRRCSIGLVLPGQGFDGGRSSSKGILSLIWGGSVPPARPPSSCSSSPSRAVTLRGGPPREAGEAPSRAFISAIVARSSSVCACAEQEGQSRSDRRRLSQQAQRTGVANVAT